MQISDLKRHIFIVLCGVTLALGGNSARAFDASKIVKDDTPSNKIFEFFFKFRKDGKKEEAFEVLKYAADHGNPAAQWKLARIYQTGDGVEPDPLLAFGMFQKIAAAYPLAHPNTPNWQFSADALVALGDYYKKGIRGTNVTADRQKAKMMYTTAAMVFRHPSAQFELGRMQLLDTQGFGQQRQGIRNLTLAYQKGHVGAEALLGYATFEGEYINRDPIRGLVMLGNAMKRAQGAESEWIRPLHDEAYALAAPDQRIAAIQQLAQN